MSDSITVPAQGVHVLSLRLKDEDGVWGSTFSKAIMVNPALSSRTILVQAAEYFWDTDPGVGNGTALLAFDGNFDQALEHVFASATLPSAGNHIFNIRIQDEDANWGDVYSKVILIDSGIVSRNIQIQEGEYYWDTDPVSYTHLTLPTKRIV